MNIGYLKTEGDAPGLEIPEQWKTMHNSPRGNFKDYMMKLERNKAVFSNLNSPKDRVELLPKMINTTINWSNNHIKSKLKRRRLP